MYAGLRISTFYSHMKHNDWVWMSGWDAVKTDSSAGSGGQIKATAKSSMLANVSFKRLNVCGVFFVCCLSCIWQLPLFVLAWPCVTEMCHYSRGKTLHLCTGTCANKLNVPATDFWQIWKKVVAPVTMSIALNLYWLTSKWFAKCVFFLKADRNH